MSKTNPLVEEVELLQANPHYAHVRHQNGEETTASIRHLATVETAGEEPQETPSNSEEVVLDSTGKSLDVVPTEVDNPAPQITPTSPGRNKPSEMVPVLRNLKGLFVHLSVLSCETGLSYVCISF